MGKKSYDVNKIIVNNTDIVNMDDDFINAVLTAIDKIDSIERIKGEDVRLTIQHVQDKIPEHK